MQFADNYLTPGLLKKPKISHFRRGKNFLKNFPKYKSIVYSRLLIDSKRLLFLTEHNPSFTMFLICSCFLTQLSFDVLTKCVLIKKRVYYSTFLKLFVIIFNQRLFLFCTWHMEDLPQKLKHPLQLIPPLNILKLNAFNSLQPGVAFLYPLMFSEGIEKQRWAVMG